MSRNAKGTYGSIDNRQDRQIDDLEREVEKLRRENEDIKKVNADQNVRLDRNDQEIDQLTVRLERFCGRFLPENWRRPVTKYRGNCKT